MAGVALGDIARHFAWQAWHLATSTFVLHGKRSTYGTGLALVTRLGPVDALVAAALCVAGVALGDIDRHLRGRCGTWRHQPSFCVAGAALMSLAGSGDALGSGGRRGRRGTLRGRRGTW